MAELAAAIGCILLLKICFRCAQERTWSDPGEYPVPDAVRIVFVALGVLTIVMATLFLWTAVSSLN